MAHLSQEFLSKYKTQKPPHEVTGMIVYKRTYSRNIESEGRKEEWWETCAREVNSIMDLGLKLTREEMEDLYDSCFNLICSFSGRAKWQLGSPTVERIGGASMNNCWGVVVDCWKSFVFTFDMLMLGGGVGFNIQRENVYQIPKVKPGVVITRKDTNDADFIVPDSREGWCELLSRVMQAFFETGKGFSYSTVCIRGKGVPIKGFGGVSSGPEDLCIGLQKICNVIGNRSGKKIRPIDALDVMDLIAEIVVAGNTRRSALISVGDMDDVQFLNAKRWDLGIPNWRKNSNNSIVCNDIKLLPTKYWNSFKKDPKTGFAKGEIYGLINLNLARKKGRVLDWHRTDPEVYVFNPCIAKGNYLLTSNGHEEISSLVGRDDLLIHDGHGWVPGKVWSNGIKSTITLFGSKGTFFSVTPDHKIKTKNGWKEACDCIGEIVHTIMGDQEIVDIDDNGGVEVFDFSVESDYHQGYVNGVMVHNCGEIGLSAVPNTGEGESCNLFELFIARMENKDHFIRIAKLGYKVVKTIASLRYHWENTNTLIHENMRLGISVSGMCEWLPKLGREEAANWLDSCYKELEYLDASYSKEMNWPESIKLTTVKPSGSLSKLCHTSPGVHPFYAPYYIQRIRFASEDPLLDKLREANYPIEYQMEFDGTLNTSTSIVSFPMKAPEGSIMAKDMSAVDQMELVKFMNTYWSDNSTSVTVYYKEEELDSIKEWLENNYNDYIKSISFLLHSDHGFKQAPMEEIDEATYKKMTKNLKEIDFSLQKEGSFEIETNECSTGACPIK